MICARWIGTCVTTAVMLVFAAVGNAQLIGNGDVNPVTQPVTITQPLPGSRPGTFNITFHELDMQMVLRILSAQGRKNIVATKEVTGMVTASLRDVTFSEALDAVMESTGHVYQKKGNFIYVYTRDQLAAIQKAKRKMDVRIFHLSYMPAPDAKTLLAPALSSDGTITTTPAAAVGISTSSSDAGGNTLASSDVLIVRDYVDVLAKIESLLKVLDVKPDQVLIEATILRASLSEENALGVDFNALAGIDFQGLNATSPGMQSVATGTLTSAQLPRDQAATFRTDFNAGITGGGMTIGFVANEIAFFIRALEGVTDVTVLANPKLLVVNKQRGEVMIGNRDGYLTTTITETVATQTVEFLETGTRLVVRPYIARDGYIRLELHPEDSSGSVAQVGNNVLPSETTTEVTSNVLVRDGHTIVIGGLFREQTTNGRSQVPVLGNLPYIGSLFRRTSDAIEREEVIILVTPRIIKQGVDEATSQQFKNDVERFRVGQRKGLRWWGRDRLANLHMRWAKNALRKGKKWLALWNVDMALGMAPTMEEAVRLKERLTNRAYWADETRVSSTKYVIQRMIMQELGKPGERIIPPDRPMRFQNVDPDVRKKFNMSERFVDPVTPVRKPIKRRVIKTDAPPADKKIMRVDTNSAEKKAEGS